MGKAGVLAAVGMVLGTPFAFAAETTTVTGVLYDDVNRNGVQDAGEPGLPGLTVHGDTDVKTDADGRYTLTGVPVGEQYSVFLPTSAKGGEVTLSKPAGATGDGWVSGWVNVDTSGDPVAPQDFGYGRWGADQAVSLGFADTAGHDPSHVQVGDKIRLTAHTTTGDAPGYGGVLITVPAGMHVVHAQLSPGTAYDWLDARHARAFGLRNQDANQNREYVFDVVADKPATGTITATLTHDAGTDTNATNDKVDQPVVVRAAAVQHVVAPVQHISSGNTPPPLAYTGVEPKPYLAAGVALLGVGAALVGVARSRPRLTEVRSN